MPVLTTIMSSFTCFVLSTRSRSLTAPSLKINYITLIKASSSTWPSSATLMKANKLETGLSVDMYTCTSLCSISFHGYVLQIFTELFHNNFAPLITIDCNYPNLNSRHLCTEMLHKDFLSLLTIIRH